MPVYPYRCEICGRQWEALHHVDDRHKEMCCMIMATRLIATSAKPIVLDYFSENLDTYITGPAHKRRVLQQKGLEEVGNR